VIRRPKHGLPRPVDDPDLRANLLYMLGLIGAGGQATASPFVDAGLLADGAQWAPNFALSSCVRATVAGDLELLDPIGVTNGGTYVLLLEMSGAATRALTWSSFWHWVWGDATLSSEDGARDIATFVCDGTRMDGVMQNDFLNAPRGP